MGIILRYPEYLKHEKELSSYVRRVLKNVRIVILDDSAEDILRRLNIRWARSTKYKISRIPVPVPIEPKLKGVEFQISPDRLFYLVVEPLLREFRGYVALDTYADRPICVLDTGINDRHRLFIDNYILVEKLSVVGDDGSDELEHGSHVCGIIATLAPYSHLVSIKVFKGEEATTEDLLAGMDLAMEKRCAVVNMSLGGYPSEDEAKIMEEVLEDMKASGIVPVAAAGNEMQIGRVAFPASSKNTIAVGSINILLVRSYFSNVDPINEKPEVVAFGEKILSATNKDNEALVEKSGTSMATPVASAVAYYLHYFHNVARSTSYTPLYILGAVVDPRLDPFEAVKRSLIQLSFRNNPFYMWNTNYAWGIVSFRKLTNWDIPRSAQYQKPYPVLPPLSFPQLIDKYPDYLRQILERLLGLGDANTILQIISMYRDRVLEILFNYPDLAEKLIALIPALINILPELVEMYPQLVSLIRGGAVTWESLKTYVAEYVASTIEGYYFPSFEETVYARDKLLVAFRKGLSSVVDFSFNASSPVTLNVYLTNDLRVVGGTWKGYMWLGGKLADDFSPSKSYSYENVDSVSDQIITDYFYIVFEAVAEGVDMELRVNVRK